MKKWKRKIQLDVSAMQAEQRRQYSSIDHLLRRVSDLEVKVHRFEHLWDEQFPKTRPERMTATEANATLAQATDELAVVKSKSDQEFKPTQRVRMNIWGKKK